jgi:hypothetical protein
LQDNRAKTTLDKETVMLIHHSKTFAATILALAAVFGSCGAQAQGNAQHPAYLHALSDLRLAHWNLTHRGGDAAVTEQEGIAVAETDHAIREATRAAELDAKPVGTANVHEDAQLDRAGALHHAQDLLAAARQDIARREDNPRAREIQGRIVEHIDRALEATRHAIFDVEHRR